MGESGFMGLRGFQTPHPQVWYIIGFSSSSWTFWYHTWPLPTWTWPLLANSRREWPTPPCYTSLDSEHQAEHFDTSLDNLSQVVFEIFKFLRSIHYRGSPEVVRFGSEVVKCGIKMFSSKNWIQWCNFIKIG